VNPSTRNLALILGAAFWLGSVQGCDVADAVGSQEASAAASTGAETQLAVEDLVRTMEGAELSTHYRGTRSVLLVDPARGEELAYLEHIGCDGLGRFAIETTMADAPADVAEEFEIRQQGQQGYILRHRDLAIRDAEAFLACYSVEHAGREEVAGFSCVVLRIQRKAGSSLRYSAHIEPATGLVLRSEMHSGEGQLLSRVEYQSLELGADLDGLLLDEHRLPRTQIDPSLAITAFDADLDFSPQLPEPPPGYRLIESSLVGSPSGEDWLKLTWSDGLESLVLLQTPLVAGEADAEYIDVTTIGSANLLQGVLGRSRVMVLSRLEREVLLGWLESSF